MASKRETKFYALIVYEAGEFCTIPDSFTLYRSKRSAEKAFKNIVNGWIEQGLSEDYIKSFSNDYRVVGPIEVGKKKELF